MPYKALLKKLIGKPSQGLADFLDPGWLDLDGVLDAAELEVVPTKGLGKTDLKLRKCPPARRKLAIAISGGGASGAYSAGVLEALLARLRQRRISVDLLVGTSSGAINAYGVFVEQLGAGKAQARRRRHESVVASMWSQVAHGGRASRWVVGSRSWIIRLASRGASSLSVLKRIWFLVGRAAAPLLLQLGILLPVAALLSWAGLNLPNWLSTESVTSAGPRLFGLYLVLVTLIGIAFWIANRAFRDSIFSDLPLLRLLTNTTADGSLRPRHWSLRTHTVHHARSLSRLLVNRWYRRRASKAELIVTGTDITAERECLFTLVRPETYGKLLDREWTAVQFDADIDDAKAYRGRKDATFCAPERFLQAILASASIPGAFPAQRIEIYRPGASGPVRHHFVDGGVLNNSPVHIAIDAGATHVISLEIQPYPGTDPLAKDVQPRESVGFFQALLSTLTTVLERATDEDIRRTASWNRFLLTRPGSLGPDRSRANLTGRKRRIVPIYRIAPRERLLRTFEFDGAIVEGRGLVTPLDLLRQGIFDMKAKNIWAATVRHDPAWKNPKEVDG